MASPSAVPQTSTRGSRGSKCGFPDNTPDPLTTSSLSHSLLRAHHPAVRASRLPVFPCGADL